MRRNSTNPFDDNNDIPNNSKSIKHSINPFDDVGNDVSKKKTTAPPIIFSTSSGVELHAATGGFAAPPGKINSVSHSYKHDSKQQSSDFSSGFHESKRQHKLGSKSSGGNRNGNNNMDHNENFAYNDNRYGGSSGAFYSSSSGGGRTHVRSNSYKGYHSSSSRNVVQSNNDSNPIWISRNVEWPVPHTLSEAVITSCVEGTFAGVGGCDLSSSGGGDYNSDKNTSGSKAVSMSVGSDGEQNQNNSSSIQESSSAGDESGGAGSYITGLFSRVLPTNQGSQHGNNTSHGRGNYGDYSSGGKVKVVLSPTRRCVASSNGWVVAVVEVSSASSSKDDPNTVRLISRWNVRRGIIRAEETIVPLPPPVKISTPNVSPSDSIKGVFIDPTGCHIFISAANGEAYHLHSSSRKPRKLQGFGVEKNIEGKGIDINSGFITSVAWDRERGTEGSTKDILLGTSKGEIYQTSLMGPNADSNSSSSDEKPILLHVLDCDEDGDTAAVSGLHFERVSGAR